MPDDLPSLHAEHPVIAPGLVLLFGGAAGVVVCLLVITGGLR